MQYFNPHETSCWITGETSEKGNGASKQPVKQLFDDGSEILHPSVTEAAKHSKKDVSRIIGRPFKDGMRFVYA